MGRKTRYKLPEDSITRKAPVIAGQWNHELNERDGFGSPDDYTIGSGVKAWWHCNHGHDWKAAICDRIRGRGCPYCSNKLLLKGYNDLETMCPWITMRWDYFMNRMMRLGEPSDYLYGSHAKVWVKCGNPLHPSRYLSIQAIMDNYHCLYCIGKLPVKGINDLETLYPWIARQWYQPFNDYEHLGTPDMYLPRSGRKAWFWCGNPLHKPWKTAICNRTLGKGCPQCHPTGGNLIITPGVNDLESQYPWIARQWYQPFNDYEHLGTPDMYFAHSGVKVWWWCGNPLHKPWKATIGERTGDARHSSGCPQCAHMIPSPDWNFKIICPEKSALWDYDLNNDSPEDYTPYSNEYKWFKCENGEHESFKAMIRNVSDGYSCPQCPHHNRSEIPQRRSAWLQHNARN